MYTVVDACVGCNVRGQDGNPRQLGLATYIERPVKRLYDAFEPNDDRGEPALLLILNRYKPMGLTTEGDFKSTHPCYGSMRSDINQVVLDSATWEQSAVFRLEQSYAVAFYTHNDYMECVIPYEYRVSAMATSLIIWCSCPTV